MAVGTPPNILAPAESVPPIPFGQLVWPRDIRQAQNALSIPLPGTKHLFAYQRISSPVILSTFFAGTPLPLTHLLHRSRAPHVFHYDYPIDHVMLTLASLLTPGGNVGSGGIGALPQEGSSLSYASSSATPRGDGYIFLTGLDRPAFYDQPVLETSPRYMIPFNGTLAGQVGGSVIAIGPGAIPITVTRVDLINAGVPGTNVAISFQVSGFDAGGQGFSNNQTTGTLSSSGSGLWNLQPGQAESVDFDNAPGSSCIITINNSSTTTNGLYVVNVWGY